MVRAWDSSPILRVPVRVPTGGTNKTMSDACFLLSLSRQKSAKPFPVGVVEGGTY